MEVFTELLQKNQAHQLKFFCSIITINLLAFSIFTFFKGIFD